MEVLSEMESDDTLTAGDVQINVSKQFNGSSERSMVALCQGCMNCELLGRSEDTAREYHIIRRTASDC